MASRSAFSLGTIFDGGIYLILLVLIFIAICIVEKLMIKHEIRIV